MGGGGYQDTLRTPAATKWATRPGPLGQSSSSAHPLPLRKASSSTRRGVGSHHDGQASSRDQGWAGATAGSISSWFLQASPRRHPLGHINLRNSALGRYSNSQSAGMY